MELERVTMLSSGEESRRGLAWRKFGECEVERLSPGIMRGARAEWCAALRECCCGDRQDLRRVLVEGITDLCGFMWMDD